MYEWVPVVLERHPLEGTPHCEKILVTVEKNGYRRHGGAKK